MSFTWRAKSRFSHTQAMLISNLRAGPVFRRLIWQIEAGGRRLARQVVKDNEFVLPGEFNPEDKSALCKEADKRFRGIEKSFPLGTLRRSRQLLLIIGQGFPTQLLTDAYFENLEAMMAFKTPLRQPGTLVIGLGSGRSGSTTFAARLEDTDGSCSTHENPPLVYWRPEPEQIAFHFRRFRLLTRYFPLVADSAHWWINLVDPLVSEFPTIKFVGMRRDKFDCAVSFARIKGFGRGSYNHWAPHLNGIWRSAMWDPAYPTFEVPAWANRNPDRAKWQMIVRYLDIYNSLLTSAATRLRGKFIMMHTELLNDPDALKVLYDHIGVNPKTAVKMINCNVKSIKDGDLDSFKM
jgi:hypothetical protein